MPRSCLWCLEWSDSLTRIVLANTQHESLLLEFYSGLQMNLDSTDDSTNAPMNKQTQQISLKRIAWPVAYVITVTLIFGWYEFLRPAFFAQQLHGSWREVKGGPADEEFTDTHLRFDGNETWLTYPNDESWTVQRSRVSIRPSHDFFHVALEHGFDSRRNVQTAEYFVYRRDDQLYILRGIAKLDPIRLPTVNKLLRVDDIPDKAEEAIAKYLEKLDQD